MATLTINNTVCNFTSCVEYGWLYSWYTITDARGMANSGWRMPTKADIDALIVYIGGTANGGDLKNTSLSYWLSPNTGATNSTGFNARGAGYRTGAGDIGLKEWFEMFLLDSVDAFNGYAFRLSHNSSDGGASGKTKWTGGSARLIKESTTLSHGQSGVYTGLDGKNYVTICIGAQEWLSDNLAETLFANGDTIPLVEDASLWTGTSFIGRAAYNNNYDNVGCGTTG